MSRVSHRTTRIDSLGMVNPNTRLPISVERSYAKAITSADHEVVSVTDHYNDMKFDVPLTDELFSVTPPDGMPSLL